MKKEVDEKYEKDSRNNKGTRFGSRAGKRKTNKGGSFKRESNSGLEGKSQSSARYSHSGSFDNDPKWYSVATPEGTSAAANISYFIPTGTRYQYNTGNSNDIVNMRSVPGVGVIYWAPSIGYADAQNAPINVAARNIYSFVRHANSGHSNYESTNLMQYLLTMDGIYSWISTLRRVYGICKLYSNQNRYVGKALVESMGFDYDNIIKNLEDIRAYINIISVKAGSMCVPNTMPYTVRHIWMNQNVFWDNDTNKSQMYMYVQGQYPSFELDPDKTVKAGRIKWYTIPSLVPDYAANSQFLGADDGLAWFQWGSEDYNDIQVFTTRLLDPILNSEDFAIMSGDILKAYGESSLVHLTELTNDYTTPIVYSPDVLDQINNATFVGQYDADTFIKEVIPNPTLDPKNSYLEFKPHFVMYTRSAPTENFMVPVSNNWVINFEHAGITPDDTMVATRLLNVFDEDDFTSEWYRFGNCYAVRPTGTVKTMGSDIAIAMHVFYYGDNPARNHNLELLHSDLIYTVNPVTIDPASVEDLDLTPQQKADALASLEYLTVSRLALLDKFDRHPRVVVPYQIVYHDGDNAYTSTPNWLDVHGDINYYTFVTPDKLQMFSLAALVSEFDVTQFGRSGT